MGLIELFEITIAVCTVWIIVSGLVRRLRESRWLGCPAGPASGRMIWQKPTTARRFTPGQIVTARTWSKETLVLHVPDDRCAAHDEQNHGSHHVNLTALPVRRVWACRRSLS